MTIKFNFFFKQQKVRETSGILFHCINISSVFEYKNTYRDLIQNCKQLHLFPLTALKLVQNKLQERLIAANLLMSAITKSLYENTNCRLFTGEVIKFSE